MANRKPLAVNGGAIQEVQSGDVVDPSSLGTGTADATTFLRGDGTWATPAGGGGASGPDIFAFAAAYG